MICSSVQRGIFSVFVVLYPAYGKPIEKKRGSGKWGCYKNHHHKRER
jgi:hypothetical protein